MSGSPLIVVGGAFPAAGVRTTTCQTHCYSTAAGVYAPAAGGGTWPSMGGQQPGPTPRTHLKAEAPKAAKPAAAALFIVAGGSCPVAAAGVYAPAAGGGTWLSMGGIDGMGGMGGTPAEPAFEEAWPSLRPNPGRTTCGAGVVL